MLHQCGDMALIHQPQHLTDQSSIQIALPVGDRLIGQAQGVTHTAVSGAAQLPKRSFLKWNRFFTKDVAQVLHNPLRRHIFQVELQTTRQYGHRQFLRICGRQQEFNVGRWLFQRFQQGVETVGGEHVHFVDQVDLKAPAGRCVLHVVQQFTGVFHLGA